MLQKSDYGERSLGGMIERSDGRFEGIDRKNMLVIHLDECIDCGVCEPECPAQAIKLDTEEGLENWLKLNREYAAKWPNLTAKELPPADAKEWDGVPDKLSHFSPNPHEEQSGAAASPP